MQAIPLFIVEEHHEVLLIWQQRIQAGKLPREGNALLHVDEHSDLAIPTAQCDLREAFQSTAVFRDFVYRDLHVGSFLYPAMYLGIFNRLYWMRRKQEPDADSRILAVKSLRGEGRVLQPASTTDPMDLLNEDRRAFRLTPVTDSQTVEFPDSAIVLDIDLDYFSCNNEAGESWRIEVTKEEHDSYLSDPYGKTRLLTGGVLRPVEEAGRYYFIRNAESEALREPEESILNRIRGLMEFLRRNRVHPELIHIARSRLSGYTPPDQWEFIEANVISALKEAFELDLQK